MHTSFKSIVVDYIDFLFSTISKYIKSINDSNCTTKRQRITLPISNFDFHKCDKLLREMRKLRKSSLIQLH